MTLPIAKALKTEVNRYSSHTKIRLGLIEQISKDFEMCGFEFETSFTSDDLYSELHYQISSILETTIPHNTDKLTALLYRIDIPELEAKAIFAEFDAETAPAKLANSIIKRELVKVVMRAEL